MCLCHERATPGQCDATYVSLHVCLSACFCGLNPRTVPQLSLIKFRAPLGYRGLVLGLNGSYFFRSLGTSNGTRAEQTRPTEVADIITSQKIAGSAGPTWTPVSVPACFFVVIVFLGVSVDAT